MEVLPRCEALQFCSHRSVLRNELPRPYRLTARPLLRWSGAAIFVAILIVAGSAVAQPHEELDTSFLRKEPYKKQKQTVDLSSIRNQHDLQIVSGAIDQIMAFFGAISQVRLDPARLAGMATASGAKNLRLPPPMNQNNRQSARRIYDWKVTGNRTIALTVEFRGLQAEPQPYVDTFIFINSDGRWRFDGH